MDFSTLKSLFIPEGEVKSIVSGDGTVLWEIELDSVEEDVTPIFYGGYKIQEAVGNAQYGQPVSASWTTDYAISDFIVLEDGYEYTIYGSNVSGLSCYCVWYTSTGGIIEFGSTASSGWSSSASGNVSKVIDPPQGAGQIRLQGYTGTDTSKLGAKVTVKRVPNPDRKYGSIPITWIEGAKLSKTENSIEETGTTYSASEEIFFEDGVTYTAHISVTNNMKLSILYLDTNKNVISFLENIINSDTENTYTITPPSNAVSCRLRFYANSTDNTWRYIMLYLLKSY